MNLGLLGALLTFIISVFGSAWGILVVGQVTVGAWKKGFIANKPASMIMLAFTGNPLTQIFYSFILLGRIKDAALANPENGVIYLGVGLFLGILIGFTALVQGKIGAVAVEAIGETGKGFAPFYAVMGIAETTALFAMVFTMISL